MIPRSTSFPVHPPLRPPPLGAPVPPGSPRNLRALAGVQARLGEADSVNPAGNVFPVCVTAADLHSDCPAVLVVLREGVVAHVRLETGLDCGLHRVGAPVRSREVHGYRLRLSRLVLPAHRSAAVGAAPEARPLPQDGSSLHRPRDLGRRLAPVGDGLDLGLGVGAGLARALLGPPGSAFLPVWCWRSVPDSRAAPTPQRTEGGLCAWPRASDACPTHGAQQGTVAGPPQPQPRAGEPRAKQPPDGPPLEMTAAQDPSGGPIRAADPASGLAKARRSAGSRAAPEAPATEDPRPES